MRRRAGPGLCFLFSPVGLKDFSELYLPLESGQQGSFMVEPVLTTNC